MDETSPRIHSQHGPQGWQVTLGGSWSAAELARPAVWSRLQRSIDGLLPQVRDAQAQWDLRSLDRLDHTCLLYTSPSPRD